MFVRFQHFSLCIKGKHTGFYRISFLYSVRRSSCHCGCPGEVRIHSHCSIDGRALLVFLPFWKVIVTLHRFCTVYGVVVCMKNVYAIRSKIVYRRILRNLVRLVSELAELPGDDQKSGNEDSAMDMYTRDVFRLFTRLCWKLGRLKSWAYGLRNSSACVVWNMLQKWCNRISSMKLDQAHISFAKLDSWVVSVARKRFS